MHKYAKLLAICLLLVGSILFFVGVPEYSGTRSIQRAWDLGHLAFFLAATLAWLTWRGKGTRSSFLRTWLLVLVTVNLAGCAIEGIQSLIGRSPSLSDLFLNNVGALIALGYRAVDRESSAPWKLRLLRGTVFALLIWAFTPLASAISDEYSASRAFPILADFETPFQLSRWESDVELSLEREIVREGTGAMRVPLSTARYSTASLQYFEGDWTGSSALAASIFNPDSEPLEIVLRVHDASHDERGQRYDDRFNTTFTLVTGWNDISMSIVYIANGPRSRTMNMEEIRGLSFFSVDLPSPRTIIIDQVELR